MVSGLIVIAAAIVVAGTLMTLFPKATGVWFNRIQSVKELILGVLSFLFAIVLVTSGQRFLVALGFVALVFIAIRVAMYTDIFEPGV